MTGPERAPRARTAGPAGGAPDAPLYAGAAVSDITPEPGGSMAGFAARQEPSAGVHDPLSAVAVAVADTATTSVVIAADLIALDPETAAAVAERVSARTGVPARNVAVAVTHTHGGPAVTRGGIGGVADSGYVASLVERLARAGVSAVGRLVPATVASGHARLTDVAHNRRGGTLTDPCVPVLRLDHTDGKPLATVFSHACHPVVLGPDNREITADWPGRARRTVEDSLGGTALFLQGCAGQLNTGHSAQASYRGTRSADRTFAAAERIGDRVARAVVAAAGTAVPGTGPVRVAAADLDLPLGPPVPRDDLRAQAEQWARAAAAADPGERGVPRCWARWAHACLDTPAPATVGVPVAVHRWGPARLAFLPAEPFAEFALGLRDALADPGLLVAGYTGGVPGYLPYPPDAYLDGGYEVLEAHRAYGLPAAFAPAAGPQVAAAARALAETVGGDT